MFITPYKPLSNQYNPSQLFTNENENDTNLLL